MDELEWMSLFSSPNILSNEVKRDIPRAVLPMTKKGLLNNIENTHAWKESVITNSAS